MIGLPAIKPGEEISEQPKFINPVLEEPMDHVVLDEITEILGGITERGRACIELLDLNRDGLIEERQRVYLYLRAIWLEAILALRSHDMNEFDEKVRIIESYKNGERAYSLAGRKACDDAKTLFEPFVRRLMK